MQGNVGVRFGEKLCDSMGGRWGTAWGDDVDIEQTTMCTRLQSTPRTAFPQREFFPQRKKDPFSLRLEAIAMGCSQEAGNSSMPRSDPRRSLSPLAGCRKSPLSRLEAQKDPFSLGLNAIGTSAWLKLAGCSMPLPREALRTTSVPHSQTQKDLFFLRLRTIGAGAWLRLAGCRRPSVPLPREALKTTSAPHTPEFYVWADPVDDASR